MFVNVDLDVVDVVDDVVGYFVVVLVFCLDWGEWVLVVLVWVF